MSRTNPDPRRRHLLRIGAAGLLAAPLAQYFLASASAAERVSEDDPQAQALHYRHDVADVDHEAFEEGRNCANCMLFTEKDGSSWGPCEVFGGSHVAAAGWCTAWVPKG